MKICIKCRHRKRLENFAIKTGDKKSSWCKDCHSKYSKKHYKKNLAKYREKAKRNRLKTIAANRKILLELKKNPCTDCKVQYPPWVMDFDHLRDKNFCVSRGLMLPTKTLMKEAEKCEIVCSNCHRDRTHKRRVSRRGGTVDTLVLGTSAYRYESSNLSGGTKF